MGLIPNPTVSVVIPTRGRPAQVVEAVESALAQSFAPTEVIVVIDGPDADTARALNAIGESRLHTVQQATSGGAASARNAGVSAATGHLVAFLDDDDQWLPTKLERQITHLRACADPEHTVLGCVARWETGAESHAWPTRAPRRGEPVADYLFVRDHAGEGALATPTVMLPRTLALACPMPTDAPTHEEWAWFLDLERHHGARFEVVMEPLVVVDARPRRTSVSTGSEWRTSMDWASGHRTALGPRAYSGFVLTEVARAAALGSAPLRDHATILTASFRGRPRPRDLARFAARPLALKWRGRGSHE